MTTMEITQLLTLKSSMEEMYQIIVSNPLFSERYAKRKLREIVDYIGDLNTDSEISYDEAINIINQQYQTMFPPRGGLSEFHFWNENFETQRKSNEEYDAVKRNIENILHDSKSRSINSRDSGRDSGTVLLSH